MTFHASINCFAAAIALDGNTPFHLLWELLDPTVQFEVDTYWVHTSSAQSFGKKRQNDSTIVGDEMSMV